MAQIPMWKKKGLNALRRGLALACAALVGGAAVAASAAEPAATYCVIDLSAGADATSYPVTTLDAVPEGGWTTEYKTTKLVLRRCPAGEDPLRRYTLTRDFYAGVFEVTEKQWELVMGANPSKNKLGDDCPVEFTSYNDIRGTSEGAQWPESSAVDATSFLGILRAKTGLEKLDLPTEAQWEYACRAGTTTKYNTGDTEADLAAAGWYNGNSSTNGYPGGRKYPVGEKRANAWGLYDMHGNVWEWCLDWQGDPEKPLGGADPVGATSPGSEGYRYYRGGAYSYQTYNATSSRRNSWTPSYRNKEIGFRVFCTVRVNGAYGPFAPGEPVSIALPDLVGYAAKGLPAGLKFNAKTGAITGAATKPTAEGGVTVTFTKRGEDTLTTRFVVGPFPVLFVSAPDAPATCKVSGTGAYAAGKKVTLRATAAKGFVFAGWYTDADFETPLPGDVDFRSPSYSYEMPTEDVALFARFVSADEDAAALLLPPVAPEYAPKEAIEPIALDVKGCVSLPKVTVKGLPPGLKFTAKKLITRDGSVLKANTVYGAPTKSGVYEMTATVTTAGKRTATETILFAVVDRAKGEYVLKIASDATKGKVTGAGVYAAGKKVTLKATPAKGYVFTGWYQADGTTRLNGEGDVDGRTPSITYVMPDEDAQVVAQFRSATDPLASQIGLDVGGVTVLEEVTEHATFQTDGALALPLSVSSDSLPKMTVAGLPPGLKFTAKRLLNRDGTVLAEANTVYGTATKPGTYVVTVKITNAAVKKAVERRFAIAVDNLTGANGLLLVTDAASGETVPLKNGRGQQYTVYMGVEKHDLPAITVNDSADKLTLAGLPAGLKYDAKQGAITGVPTKAGFYTVTATVRSGRESSVSTFTVEVVALPEWAIGTFGGLVEGSCADAEDEEDSWREYGTVTLKVSSAGKVTAKVLAGGKTWSFSADGFAAHDAARDAYWFRMETRAGDVYEGEIWKGFHDVAELMKGARDGDPEGMFAPADCEPGREPYRVLVWRNEHGRDGRLDADATGRARTALDAVKAAGRFAFADFDAAWGTVAVTVDARGNVKVSGTTANGVKVLAGGFLALDDEDPFIVAPLVFYDRKTGLVYDCAVSWQPDFDEDGNLVGSAEDWFDYQPFAPYPFE